MSHIFRVCLGFSMIMNLPIGLCPRLWETTALSVFNRSKDTTPSCCSSDWLIQLQQSWCPLLRLLILGIIALPIYNVVLILVGWRFNGSTRSTAELLVRHPVRQPPPVPPKPPPRIRRRPSLTPPKRSSSPEVVPNSTDMNPFADQEAYQILRRNLQLVLRGLQNPPLEVAPPRIPEPIMKPTEIPSGLPSGIPSGMPSGMPSKVPSRIPPGIPSEQLPSRIPSGLPSWLPSEIPSDIPSEIPSEIPSDATSLCPFESPKSEAQKKRSKVIFKRLWQRWRSRNKLKKSKKSLVSASSSSCCSTNGSSCFYVYLEET
ncbi:hypothetical protein KR200_005509 [Drosophila serrata]|nr:hypothetical protein KR200_005509 [Drosophila serrata]